MRNLLILIVGFVLASAAVAQDAATDPEQADDTPAVEPATEETVADDPEFDETGLDEQGFANEDDDFDPTEDIPTDQSIDFPADI